MDRPERPSRDKVQVTPEASRPDLFQFLEKLFDGADQKPERIELRQAYGDGARKYGTVVIQKEYKANAAKPSREAIVSLSNELLDLAQRNCNELRKPYRYAILAKHYAKSDDYYGCFLLSMRPKQPATQGDDAGPLAADEDENTDAKRRDSLLDYSIAHLKQSDENDRWRQDQHATSTGDIIEKYQNLVQMLMSQNLEMQREHRELFKTADEALSKKSERDLAVKMQDFKMGIMSDGFKFIQQMAPVVVNQLKGKTPGVGEPSAESMAVTSFLQGLTEKQAAALFGEMDTVGNWTENGIFSHAQAKIFSAVAQCQVAPSELDKLLDGEHAVREDQIMKAQTVVASQQFMPLVALFMAKRQKKLEANPTGTQPSA